METVICYGYELPNGEIDREVPTLSNEERGEHNVT